MLIPPFILNSQAEEIILLENPSFEDIPGHSKTPRGWLVCGFEAESPVDVHPTGEFGVSTKPFHGNSYLGMVARDNDTWELIAQQLSKPLKLGNDYVFQIQLARSELYVSFSRAVTNMELNYINPSVLRIWGSNEGCRGQELLAASVPIDHSDWKMYQFKLSPKKNDYKFLILEIFYADAPNTVGNILLDDASNIILASAAAEVFKNYKQEFDNVPISDNQEYYSKISAGIYTADRDEMNSTTLNIDLERLERKKQIIKNHGKKLVFEDDKLFRNYRNGSRQTTYQNVHINAIAAILKSMPGYKLIVAVSGKTQKSVTKRVRELTNAFKEQGLNRNLYQFVDYPATFKKEDWLWRPNNNDLLMRLEKI